MNLRCKEGDIAVVEKDDPPCLANVRHVVRVLGSLKFDTEKQLHTWLIEPLSTDHWWVCNWPTNKTAYSATRERCLKIFVEHPDAWLRPIRKTGFNSLADIIEFTQKKPEHAELKLDESSKELQP